MLEMEVEIMLNVLHIENIAVIEKADIEFGPGLNVMTGETGAGKSIVIDAIGALMGGRISRDLVRSGAEFALITAVFSMNALIEQWLKSNDLESVSEEEELLISRKITAEGKSSCRVNGIPLSVSQVRELGERLIDIHGQNDGQKLLSEVNHRNYLDAFAGLGQLAAAHAQAYRSYTECVRSLEELKKSQKDQDRRTQELKGQIEEITAADIKPGEQDALLERRTILKNSGKLTGYVRQAYYALYGDEDRDGALSLIISAATAAESASKVAESLRDLTEGINDIRYRVEDMTSQLGALNDRLEFSPGELEAIEGRLALLQKLERRYGSVEETLLLLERAKSALAQMETLSDSIKEGEKKAESLKAAARESALKLSKIRKEKAAELEAGISAELSHLSMPGVRFQVELGEKGGPDGFDETGCDEVRFLMSANAGARVGRICRIASGGELSRIMLAMKNVLSASDEVHIQIFDEIDAGVSGIAAQRVGEKLSDLALNKQILCVTHLPQIAVMADRHFSIEKTQNNNRTFTYVNALDTEGRKHELARLMSGENITDGTLSSAGELLNAALSYKQKNHDDFNDISD
jgi:DNA repair protein RecN (Recombination protein N)